MKRAIGILISAACLAASMTSPAGAKLPPMWEDPTGDTEFNGGATPGLDQGGFDLTGGYLVAQGKDLQFSVTHSAMPPNGSLPEGFRFLWAFSVGKVSYRITAKTADLGKPDAVGGTGSDRVGKVDAMGHFRLEGQCEDVDMTAFRAINCQQLAYLEGSFDPASKTLTVLVPMNVIKAKPGTVIGPGGGSEIAICMICWVSHAAERSHQYTVMDYAFMTKTYKIPK